MHIGSISYTSSTRATYTSKPHTSADEAHTQTDTIAFKPTLARSSTSKKPALTRPLARNSEHGVGIREGWCGRDDAVDTIRWNTIRVDRQEFVVDNICLAHPIEYIIIRTAVLLL